MSPSPPPSPQPGPGPLSWSSSSRSPAGPRPRAGRPAGRPATTPGDGNRVPMLRMGLIGVVAGFSSGLFGVGGGVIMVPLLGYVAKLPHKLATGTSLSAILPIAAAGLVGYASAGEVDWAAGAFLILGGLAGAVIGTRLLARAGVPALKVAFAAVMVVTAVRMVVEAGDGAGRSPLAVGTALALVALGVATGVVAGLLGVGGGVVIVPALTILFGAPLALAKGTSLLVIVPTSAMGTLRNRSSGLAALRPALVLGASGMLSALGASQVSLALDPGVSSALFAVLLVAVAVHLAHSGLAAHRAATTAAPAAPAAPSAPAGPSAPGEGRAGDPATRRPEG